MDEAFADAVAAWTGFYTFTGAAAATLLGLLFVAVSLRLDIFRRRQVADVRDFAALTMASFLAAMIVSGLALVPHEGRLGLAVPLLVLGVAGIAAVGYVVREWIRLNPRTPGFRPGLNPWQWRGWAFIGALAVPFAGLILVAALLWRDRAGALALLAAVEGWLLTVATITAWMMLAYASGEAGSSGDQG